MWQHCRLALSAPLRFRLGAVLSIGLLTACVSAPVDQIHQFSKSFDAVNATGQPLLDDLAIAERALGQKNARTVLIKGSKDDCLYNKLRTIEVTLGFCARDAGYFSDIGDPRDTKRFRQGLAVLQSYINLIVALADGKSTSDTVAQANALLTNVAGLVVLAGGPTAPGLGVALEALKPLLSDVVNQLSAREARQLILKSQEAVSNLIAALHDSAPEVFNVMTTNAETRLGIRQSPTLAADKAKYETYRKIVANYCVLLDQLNDAWNETVAAASTPSPPTIGDLANRAGQLQADAAAVSRAYAVLRTGIVPTKP